MIRLSLPLVALALVTVMPAKADGPLIDPGASEGPRYNGTRIMPVTIEQTGDVVTVMFNIPTGVVTVNVTDAEGTLINTQTIDTFNIPFINFFLTEEGWRPGSYTITVEGLCSRTIAVE